MNKEKYYLIVESGFQWQVEAIEATENDKTKEPHYAYDYIIKKGIDVSRCDRCGFFEQIYSREMHFTNKLFSNNNHCYGWTISKKEFDTIKRIAELRPLVEEYNRLVNS